MCTLRPADGRAAYVITYDDHRGAGEANIALASLTLRGDLQIAFHRGSFLGDAGMRRAAESIANAIDDIWSDVMPSFRAVTSCGLPPPSRTADDLFVRLEAPADHPPFAALVAEVLGTRYPELANRVQVVEDVEGAAPAELRRYELGEPVDPQGALVDEVLERLAEHGSDTSLLDRRVAFAEVCRVTVPAGAVLVERGSPPGFVYLPLGHGLTVHPVGGYAPSPLHPWVPGGPRPAAARTDRLRAPPRMTTPTADPALALSTGGRPSPLSGAPHPAIASARRDWEPSGMAHTVFPISFMFLSSCGIQAPTPDAQSDGTIGRVRDTDCAGWHAGAAGRLFRRISR